MSKVHIASTLTSDQAYTIFSGVEAEGKKLPKAERRIVINGGTGVANKHLVTPQGVITEIDEAQLQQLQKVPMFNRHVKAKFITVLKKKVAPEKAAADMGVDASMPKTPNDLSNAASKSDD